MLATVVQWLVLATVTGILVGAGCTLFLRGLFATEGRLYDAPWWWLALLLPLGGLLNGLLLHYAGARRDELVDDAIVAVNEQQGRMPTRSLWVKPVAALVTLGCGGAAGKEGPCSHLGASLAAWVARRLRLNPELSKRLVACGVSAGFASVFGTPIAGALYGVELLAIGRVRHDFVFPGIIAGVSAFETTKRLGMSYPTYALALEETFSERLFLRVIALGVTCGVAAWLFIELLQRIVALRVRLERRARWWAPLSPALGGVVLALLLTVLSQDYLGLSLPLLERTLEGAPAPALGFLWKALLVAVTLGSGYYGGKVTPQFVIGALAGSACARALGLAPAFGAALGLVAVVASASNAPIAAVFMGVELFGAGPLLYFAGAGITAYLVVGHRSVYPEQQLAFSKSSWIVAPAEARVSQEKVHLSYGLLRWLHGWRRRLRRLRR